MILLILILGLVLRLISINQSLWLDEATSALATKMNLPDFFQKFMPGDFHPPLYYLTLRIWSSLFGTSEIALRSLSIIFALATIYLVFLIGKRLIGKNAGLIASLLLATSGLHIYYSQEARMYSMSTFLVALSIYIFTRILHGGRLGDWVIFSITLAIIGLTDYLPLLILPVFLAVVIITKQKKDFWIKYIMSHIILVVVMLFWFPFLWHQLHAGITVTNSSPAWVSVLGNFSLKNILLIPVKFMIGRVSFDNKYLYGLFIALVAVIYSSLIVKSAKYVKKNIIIWLWAFLTLILALIISFKFPVLNYFRFLFILPAFYLLLVQAKIGKYILIFLIAVNLLTSFMYLTNTKFQREDWRSAVNFIEKNKITGGVVIFPADSQMEAYRYYAPKAQISGPERIISSYQEIWLLRYAQPISDPTDTTRLRIEALGYIKTKEYDFNAVVVWKYNKPYAYKQSLTYEDSN